MKPIMPTLREEIEHRISLINESISRIPKSTDSVIKSILMNEKSMYDNFLYMIDFYGDHIGYKIHLSDKYTPIICLKTGVRLKIGDLVECLSLNKCGTLVFRNHTNQYAIKTADSSYINTKYFAKIDKLYEFNSNSERVECRPKHKVIKKKW